MILSCLRDHLQMEKNPKTVMTISRCQKDPRLHGPEICKVSSNSSPLQLS